MHKTIRTFLVVALTLAAARAWATPATCTVSNIDVVTTLFPFRNIGGVGLGIPVDIDAATGQITMDRSTYTASFPFSRRLSSCPLLARPCLRQFAVYAAPVHGPFCPTLAGLA